MAAQVGVQLEELAPRPSHFRPDYLRLGVLLVVAVAIHVWLVVHTAVPARDSLAYARIANNLRNPGASAEPGQPRHRIDVIRAAEQPPGYPLAVWATDILLRRTTSLPDPDRGLLAAQVANATAAVLLVVPLYFIGRMLFGRNVGFGAALLFQVLPVPARVTSDGLSEGVYLLAAAMAVLLGVRAVRRPRPGLFFLCGMAAGASYLVRPEGLLGPIAVGGFIAVAGLTRRWPRGVAAGRLAALLVGVVVVATPYMVLIGKLTNKPTGLYLTDPFDNQPARIWTEQPSAQAPVVGSGGPPFAVWWDPVRDEGTSRELWALRAVATEVTKASHYVVGGLALFALFAHRRQLLVPDPGMWVLVILGILSLGLTMYLAVRIGYVSERHTLLFVMLSCVFAAAAFEPLAHALGSLPGIGRAVVWPGLAPGGLLVLLVVSALPCTLKPLHPQREGHKHAGRWVGAHAREGDWIKDPLGWAEWYAGRTLYHPPRQDGRPEHVWVIVEKSKNGPHSLLPLWEGASALAAGRVPVYRWPVDSPPGGAVVEVFQLKYEDIDASRPDKEKSTSP